MKNTRFLRVLALVLALLMVGATLIACADDETPDNPDQPNTPNNPDDPDKGQDEEEDPYNVADSLKDVSYDGAEFTILYFSESYLDTFYIPDRTGDLIDNAVYNALSSTEERFDVTIEAIKAASDTEYSYIALVKTQIQSGLTDFDIANVHDVLGANLSLEGALVNILDVEQFDFEKPWWSTNTINSLTFMDQLYLISSSMSYNSMNSSQVTIFNKQMLDDRGVAYPYQKVLDMDWYMDDLLTAAEDFYEDTNGNGKDEEDVYGLLIPSQMYAQFESFGINLIEKNEDGDELILNANDSRAYDLVEVMYDALCDSEYGYSIERDTCKTMFQASQSAFIMVNLDTVLTTLREATFSYGIVPYPMLDDAQENYYSGYTDRFMIIPNTCDDLDYVGTIVESMSAEGYRQVTPAYYETALKGRYTRDDESIQMLEIIRDSRVIDFAYIFSNDKACTRALYQLLTKKQSKDYASYYKENESAANARIEELVSFYSSMAD